MTVATSNSPALDASVLRNRLKGAESCAAKEVRLAGVCTCSALPGLPPMSGADLVRAASGRHVDGVALADAPPVGWPTNHVVEQRLQVHSTDAHAYVLLLPANRSARDHLRITTAVRPRHRAFKGWRARTMLSSTSRPAKVARNVRDRTTGRARAAVRTLGTTAPSGWFVGSSPRGPEH